jgi:hypothetical protein
MNLLYLYHLSKDHTSKNSHILKYCGLDFNIRIWGRHNSSQNTYSLTPKHSTHNLFPRHPTLCAKLTIHIPHLNGPIHLPAISQTQVLCVSCPPAFIK